MIDMYQIENLVFEGGGIKCYAYIPALKNLLQYFPKFLKQIKGYAGTSAGSIIATFLCLDTDLDEITEIIKNFSEVEIISNSYFNFFWNIYYLFYRFGMNSNQVLEELLKKTIRDRWFEITSIKDYDPTFYDIKDWLNKDLIITSSNINTQGLVYFSSSTTPNVPVYKAVLSSCCIPGIFNPVRYDFNPDKSSRHYLVDGGLILNYPIFVFDSLDPYYSFKTDFVNKKTLGFVIITNNDMLNERKIENFTNFSFNIINILSKQIAKNYMKENDWDRTIQIFTKHYEISDLNLDNKIKDLDSNGKESINNFIKNN